MQERTLMGVMAIALLGAGPAWSADCGDTAGPDGTRIACACGDTVVTSTKLRSTDPVVDAACTGDGLVIGADHIRLECRGHTLSGESTVSESGLDLTNRRRVTIKRCDVTAFHDGIWLEDSHRKVIVLNKVHHNTDDGIDLNDDSDRNLISLNRFTDNEDDGIDLDGNDEGSSDDNIVKANFVARNATGGSGQGIEDCDACAGNQYLLNIVNQTGPDSGEGFVIEGVNSLLLGNRGRSNDGTGILVVGQGNVLKRNTFNNNGGDGICAVLGNTDGGRNRGRNNAGVDVIFDAESCPTEFGAVAAMAARSVSDARADDDDR